MNFTQGKIIIYGSFGILFAFLSCSKFKNDIQKNKLNQKDDIQIGSISNECLEDSLTLCSIFRKDINNNGNDEIFSYKLRKNEQYYNASLVISTVDGTKLWEHYWEMKESDLFDDLLVKEGNISLKEWVQRFFDGTLRYGAKFKFIKLHESELQKDWIDFYARKENVSSEDLKKYILSQKINATFSYRATWREDLIMIVFVPELEKFIGYSGGEY